MANPAELGLEAYLEAMGVAHQRQAQYVAALQASVDEVARVRELLGRLPDKVRPRDAHFAECGGPGRGKEAQPAGPRGGRTGRDFPPCNSSTHLHPIPDA